MVVKIVKSKDRIECGACRRTKGCIQTFASPNEDGSTSDRKSCSDCNERDCVFMNPDNKNGDDHEKCKCRK